MQYPDPKKLQTIWAEVPSDYYFRLNFFQKMWHEWKWLVIRHLLTKSGLRPKKILEVGCAGGHLTGLAADIFPQADVYGIDVYQAAINVAKKRYPRLKFQVADAHKLPFKKNTFDLIFSSETIEHVVDPQQMLAEIGRVMRQDGRAVIEMDSGSLPFRIVWKLWTSWGNGRVWRNAHLHPFTARELETEISSNGFLIQEKMFSHFGMAVSFLISSRNKS